MTKGLKISLYCIGGLLLAGVVAAASVYLPALRQASRYSDGITPAFFAKYPCGDRSVYFVHGPVSSLTIGGKTTTFSEDGRLVQEEGLSRLYDEKGRFDGFSIDNSEGKVTCSYDASNLLTAKLEDFDFSKGDYTYLYDEDGNLTEEMLTLSEGDSLAVSLTRRYIILAKDAYKNWTLRRTPDGQLEERILSYEEDPEGQKALYPEIGRLAYTILRKKNSPVTLRILAERYLALGEVEKAMPLLNSAVEGEDAEAIYLMGRCYAEGTGVEKDADRAAQCYEEAAEKGSAAGAVLTADRYFDAKQYERALPFLEKAADAGDAVSALRLADCYRNGWGVSQNQNEALSLYRSASSVGNLLAINRLGTCYENGRGCEVDSLSAFKAYQIAAMFGQMNAQYNLGECYRKGIGTEIDRYKARQWYTNAANAGSASARNALAEMETEELNPEFTEPGAEDGERPAVDYKDYFNF